MRTFAYAVLQTTAEFVHADNVPEEWYSDDDTDEDEESGDENSENSDNSTENDQNAETDDQNAETDAENDAETDNADNAENHAESANPRQEIHVDEAHVSRTRGVNPNLRRAASRGSDFDLRDFL
jgi:cobalamin biosynthesis protein CobT